MKSEFLILLLCFASVPSPALQLIAHRGVHQTFTTEDLDAKKTCTATRIYPPTHTYLENTLPSIQKAFDLGADMVELDVHPTSEQSPEENRLVVFHDWGLNCRTDATCENGCQCDENHECITDQQAWSYIKPLDTGYGYTADQGKTFPFRGKEKGMIPTFIEAVDLLKKNPEKSLLINVKDKYERTQKLLLKELATYPIEIRSRVFVEYQKKFKSEFADLNIPEAIWQGTGSKKCFRDYFLLGWSGYFPKSCRDLKFFVPLHQDLSLAYPALKGIQLTQIIWGWPDSFLARAKSHGSEIYLSQVETESDLQFARAHGFPGIMTDKIETIGPIVKKVAP